MQFERNKMSFQIKRLELKVSAQNNIIEDLEQQLGDSRKKYDEIGKGFISILKIFFFCWGELTLDNYMAIYV